MIDANLMTAVEQLSTHERLDLISVVWDSLATEHLPLTAAERALLDERLADIEHRPDAESSWSEVRARLRRRLP